MFVVVVARPALLGICLVHPPRRLLCFPRPNFSLYIRFPASLLLQSLQLRCNLEITRL